MMNEYRVRDSLRTDRFDPENLQEPVPEPPKPLTESLQEFQALIKGIFSKLIDIESYTNVVCLPSRMNLNKQIN
jgi:hypothetical protein